MSGGTSVGIIIFMGELETEPNILKPSTTINMITAIFENGLDQIIVKLALIKSFSESLVFTVMLFLELLVLFTGCQWAGLCADWELMLYPPTTAAD